MKTLMILATAGAVVCAAPLLTKPVALGAFDDQLTYIDSQLKDVPILLDRISKKSGYLSSEILTRIYLDNQKTSKCFDVKTELSHSISDVLTGHVASAETSIVPLAEQSKECDIVSAISADPNLKDFYTSNYSNNSPVELETSFNLFGAPTVAFKIAPINLDIPKLDTFSGPIKLSSSEILGSLKINKAKDKFYFDMGWDSFSGEFPSEHGPITVSFSDMTSEGEQYLEHKNIWLGFVTQDMKEFKVSIAGEKSMKEFLLPTLAVQSKSYSENNGIYSVVNLKASDINKVLGDFELDLSFDNMEANALSKLTSLFEEVTPQLEQGLSLTDQQTNAMITYGKKLLESTSLKINKLEYGVNNDTVLLTGGLNAKKAVTLNAEDVLANPLMLINMLSVELNAEIDKDFPGSFSKPLAVFTSQERDISEAQLNQTAQLIEDQINSQIDVLVMSGQLVDASQSWNSSMKLTDGVATVNGNQMNLPL